MYTKEEIKQNKALADNLTVTGKKGAWIISGLDDGDSDPYDTKEEAEEDCRGLKKSLRSMHLAGFVTSEK